MQTVLQANQISRILKKAGFDRAAWHPSGMIKGGGSWTSGFEVKQWSDGVSQVSLVSPRRHTHQNEKDWWNNRNQKLQAMADVLESHDVRISFVMDNDHKNIKWLETLPPRSF